MWQLRQRKNDAAALVQDAIRRKLAHACQGGAAKAMLAPCRCDAPRGPRAGSVESPGVRRCTRCVDATRGTVATKGSHGAISRCRRRSCNSPAPGARPLGAPGIGITAPRSASPRRVSIRRMEAVAEAMSAATRPRPPGRGGAGIAAAAAKKAFTEAPFLRPRWSCRTGAATRRRSAYSARRGAGQLGDGRRGSNDRCLQRSPLHDGARQQDGDLACATLAPHFLALPRADARNGSRAGEAGSVKAGHATRLGRGFAGRRAARRRWEIVRRKFTCVATAARRAERKLPCRGCGYRRPSLEGEAAPVGTGAAVPIRRPRATSAGRRDDRRPNGHCVPDRRGIATRPTR